ncbi:tetratricopeptide repeat protein [Candidatus Giovannonibacteria bacterium]|nr:tetratricopeptide repeat protein [Candidatus Giovannonibacteria bacterium]
METEKKEEILMLVSALMISFLAFSAGYFIWGGGRLYSPKNAERTAEEQELVETINENGELILEEVEKADLPVPDLDRKVTITANLPEDQKIKMTDKIKEISGILKKDPTLADSWIELGGLYQVAGDYEGAALVWEYAGAIKPKNYISFNNLGFLYRYYLKNPQLAEKNFLRASANKPDLVASYRELSDLYRYDFKAKSGEADDILLAGLEKNPNNLDLLIYLAGYYRDTGNNAKARKYYEKALSLDPGNSAIARELQEL